MANKELDEHFKICKVCGVNKRRKRNGYVMRKNKPRYPRWIGDCGRYWNGLVCPECHIKRVAVITFNTRLLNENE